MSVGMSLAVPFVLLHPEHAAVLSELAVIAGKSESDVAVFRRGIAEVLGAVSPSKTRDYSTVRDT